MKIIVVVDANIILSALLGGKPSVILFDSNFQFVSTQFTINEVRKYLPRLGQKLNLSEEELLLMLKQIPITIYAQTFYKSKIKQAKTIIGKIDIKDTNILALALKLDTYLWSQDKDFDKCGYEKLLKTKDFV